MSIPSSSAKGFFFILWFYLYFYFLGDNNDPNKRAVLTGCHPKKFAESLPFVDFIKEECSKCSVTNDYIKRITTIITGLIPLNDYLAEEYDPVTRLLTN